MRSKKQGPLRALRSGPFSFHQRGNQQSAILNDGKLAPHDILSGICCRNDAQQCQSFSPFDVEILDAQLIVQRLDHRVEPLVLLVLPVRRADITEIDPTSERPGRVYAAESADLIRATEPVPRHRSIRFSFNLCADDFRFEQFQLEGGNEQPMSEHLESAASPGLIAAWFSLRAFDLECVVDRVDASRKRRSIDRLLQCLDELLSRFFR